MAIATTPTIASVATIIYVKSSIISEIVLHGTSVATCTLLFEDNFEEKMKAELFRIYVNMSTVLIFGNYYAINVYSINKDKRI